MGARLRPDKDELRYHRAGHERRDGHGCSYGLAGTTIALPSRMTAACDGYHAMTSDRPYRRAMSEAHALHVLRRDAASQFDRRDVASLLDVLDADVDA